MRFPTSEYVVFLILVSLSLVRDQMRWNEMDGNKTWEKNKLCDYLYSRIFFQDMRKNIFNIF